MHFFVEKLFLPLYGYVILPCMKKKGNFFLKKLWSFVRRKKKLFISLLIILLIAAFAYRWWTKPKITPAPASYSIVEKLSRGKVYTGINAGGQVAVAQKLDLDVYKKDIRINKVNIKNGQAVKKGDVLITFDRNDVLQSLTSARLAVKNAQYALEDEEIKSSRESLELTTTQDVLENLQQEIKDYQKKCDRLRQDYFSANIHIESIDSDDEELETKALPHISGIYGGPEGVYEIEVYSSSTKSGKSFRFKGVESGVGTIYSEGVETKLGKYGLSIDFPAELSVGDKWKLTIPYRGDEKSRRAADAYENTLREMKRQHKKQILEEKNLRNDILLYGVKEARPLAKMRVEESRLALSRAKESMESVEKQLKERTIIAPFDGVITGMKNVVEGTKPLSENQNSVVKLGYLVADEYIIDFSLSLNDLEKVREGQEVKVNLPARPDITSLKANIDEISILPNDNGVGQYDVRALIDKKSIPEGFTLREGVQADVEVINDERDGVVRIPKAAVHYEEGAPYALKVIESKDTASTASEGVLDLNQTDLKTEKVSLELGLEGKNYIELLSGLSEDDSVVSTVSTLEDNTGNDMMMAF